MEELMNILTETCPGIDFEGQERLIDDGILDSLNIVMLVGELNEAFDISIGAEDLVPENFNSAQAIYALDPGGQGQKQQKACAVDGHSTRSSVCVPRSRYCGAISDNIAAKNGAKVLFGAFFMTGGPEDYCKPPPRPFRRFPGIPASGPAAAPGDLLLYLPDLRLPHRRVPGASPPAPGGGGPPCRGRRRRSA